MVIGEAEKVPFAAKLKKSKTKLECGEDSSGKSRKGDESNYYYRIIVLWLGQAWSYQLGARQRWRRRHARHDTTGR